MALEHREKVVLDWALDGKTNFITTGYGDPTPVLHQLADGGAQLIIAQAGSYSTPGAAFAATGSRQSWNSASMIRDCACCQSGPFGNCVV